MRSTRYGPIVLAALTVMASLTACGQQDADDQGSGGTVVTPEPTTPTTSPATTEPAITPAPQSVIDESIALLAAQLGIEPDQIEVTRAEEVTWRDGSIGCAKKGMGYTEALVPGALVELTADGTTYAFHQGGDEPPFYCKKPTEPLTDS